FTVRGVIPSLSLKHVPMLHIVESPPLTSVDLVVFGAGVLLHALHYLLINIRGPFLKTAGTVLAVRPEGAGLEHVITVVDPRRHVVPTPKFPINRVQDVVDSVC